MADHGNLLEAVHSSDACEAAIAEMNNGHLPDDPIENIFDDEVREASLPHTLITIVDRPLERVKTTITSPEALEKDRLKYHAACSCESCLKTRSTQTAPAPIMITPYRHNWIMSVMHRGNGKNDDFFDFGNCCTFQ